MYLREPMQTCLRKSAMQETRVYMRKGHVKKVIVFTVSLKLSKDEMDVTVKHFI